MERGRTVTKTKVGDRLYLPCGRYDRVKFHHYEVIQVFATHVVCRDLDVVKYRAIETFQLGDLVQHGYEPQWDGSFGESPKFVCNDDEPTPKFMRRKITEEEVDKIRCMKEEGYTNSSIARAIGRTACSVGNIINKYGLSKKKEKGNAD